VWRNVQLPVHNALFLLIRICRHLPRFSQHQKDCRWLDECGRSFLIILIHSSNSLFLLIQRATNGSLPPGQGNIHHANPLLSIQTRRTPSETAVMWMNKHRKNSQHDTFHNAIEGRDNDFSESSSNQTRAPPDESKAESLSMQGQ
jgi:hypothetical protein